MDNKTEYIELRGQVGSSFDQIDVAFKLAEQPAPQKILLASEGGATSVGKRIGQQVTDCHIRAEFAESSAVLILVAGAHRELAADGWLFVHRAWSVEAGNARHMEATRAHLEELDRNLANDIAKRTKLDVDEVMHLIETESTIAPAQALEWGFVDAIGPPAGLTPSTKRPAEVMRQAQGLAILGEQLAIVKPGCRANGIQAHAAHVAGETDSTYAAIEDKRKSRPTVAKGAGIERATSIWNAAFGDVWRNLQRAKAGQPPKDPKPGRWRCAGCGATNFKPAEVNGQPTHCYKCGAT